MPRRSRTVHVETATSPAAHSLDYVAGFRAGVAETMRALEDYDLVPRNQAASYVRAMEKSEEDRINDLAGSPKALGALMAEVVGPLAPPRYRRWFREVARGSAAFGAPTTRRTMAAWLVRSRSDAAQALVAMIADVRAAPGRARKAGGAAKAREAKALMQPDQTDLLERALKMWRRDTPLFAIANNLDLPESAVKNLLRREGKRARK